MLFQKHTLGGYNHQTGPDKQLETNSMVDQRWDGTRRYLLRAVATGMSADLWFRISPAEAQDKMTPQQAAYQDTPSGIYSCGMCTLFERPKSCKVVSGDISKDGWCKAFALAD